MLELFFVALNADPIIGLAARIAAVLDFTADLAAALGGGYNAKYIYFSEGFCVS